MSENTKYIAPKYSLYKEHSDYTELYETVKAIFTPTNPEYYVTTKEYSDAVNLLYKLHIMLLRNNYNTITDNLKDVIKRNAKVKVPTTINMLYNDICAILTVNKQIDLTKYENISFSTNNPGSYLDIKVNNSLYAGPIAEFNNIIRNIGLDRTYILVNNLIKVMESNKKSGK